MQTMDFWPVALASYSSILDNHYSPDKLIDFTNRHKFIFPKVTFLTPIPNALLVFTGGSSIGIAAYAWNNQTTWFQAAGSPAQIIELQAVIAVFSAFSNQPINIYIITLTLLTLCHY